MAVKITEDPNVASRHLQLALMMLYSGFKMTHGMKTKNHLSSGITVRANPAA